MIRIGLDIGSTTLKCVILNASGELLYKDYRRHFSRIAENAAAMLGEIAAAFPNERECELVVSGSAGMGLADDLGIPFVQEVLRHPAAVERCAARTPTSSSSWAARTPRSSFSTRRRWRCG